MSQDVKMKFKYADDATRIYAFDCDDSLVTGVSTKIKAVNSSLSAGTAGGLSSFFVSDAGSNLVVIDGATIESATVVPIEIAPNS